VIAKPKLTIEAFIQTESDAPPSDINKQFGVDCKFISEVVRRFFSSISRSAQLEHQPIAGCTKTLRWETDILGGSFVCYLWATDSFFSVVPSPLLSRSISNREKITPHRSERPAFSWLSETL